MAGVNSIVLSGIGDLTVTSAIETAYLLLLAERATLPNHPALMYMGSIDGSGSNVKKVSHAGLMAYNLPAATADGSSVTNTALTDGSTTITVTRQSKSYEASDLARIVRGDILDPMVMALDAAMSHASQLTSLICNVIDGFAATAGSSGVDLDTATLLGAGGTARVNNVEDALMTVLHGVQWRDVVIDAGTALGGNLQRHATTDGLFQGGAYPGSGYQGTWLGMDIFVNNNVPTANAGADRAGAVFGRGGLLWADGTPPVDEPGRQALIGSKVLFERDRTSKSGETAFVSHSYLGVSLGLEAGVSVITDA